MFYLSWIRNTSERAQTYWQAKEDIKWRIDDVNAGKSKHTSK